jgi:hypothetical protein
VIVESAGTERMCSTQEEKNLLMDRCPECQYPQARPARTCGWCGVPLPTDFTQEHNEKYASANERSALSPQIEEAPIATLIPPASGIGSLLDSSDDLTIPIIPGYEATKITAKAPTSDPINTDIPLSSYPLSLSPVISPTSNASKRIPFLSSDHWWLWIPFAMPFIAAILIRDVVYWSEACQTITRVLLSGAMVIGIAIAFAQERTLKQIRTPLIVAGIIVGVTVMTYLSATPLEYVQANRAEQSGDYGQAVRIYTHLNAKSDIVRVQMAWGQNLVSLNHFGEAESHLIPTLLLADGSLRDQLRAAIGTLYWHWGQAQVSIGEISEARNHWEQARSIAKGTPDGDRAANALESPQSVHGKVVWHGASVPGMTVALISSWKKTSVRHVLQDGGDRLVAQTRDDGTFLIAKAHPGTTYLFVWTGKDGDTTILGPDGTPQLTISIRALESADVGTISIEKGS